MLRHKFSCLIAGVVATLALTISAAAQSFELRGKVVGLSDGDTITVLDGNQAQHKVRFNGIDAPESSQDFGQASKRNLSTLVFGKEVVVRWSKRDRYDRLIGNVSLDGKDINLEQLKAGLAWYFRQYERDVPADKRAPYAAAKAEARAARRVYGHRRTQHRRGSFDARDR